MITYDNTIYNFDDNELARTVYLKKYALRGKKGELLENNFFETLDRMIKEMIKIEEIYVNENKNSYSIRDLENEYKHLLYSGYFIPGGRVLYALGNDYSTGTLSNCYYIPIKDDSISSIYNSMKEMAITYSMGGGCGTDISKLRPKGAKVSNSARYSTGSVSFMELFSQTTNIIGQSGRRGALLIAQDITHPDIEDFIDSKKNTDKVRYANISVKISDEFMRAVENDCFFNLNFKTKHEIINKTIKARELWDKLCKNARNFAEPGLLFWDNIINESTSEFDDRLKLRGVNPCAEATLSDYGSCNLGSIFLQKFVKNPFKDNASFDWKEFNNSIYMSVRFLDNIVTINTTKHPLKEQREIDELGRRIGLGISGLGDMLAMLNIKYDSEEALNFADELFNFFRDASYIASISLAKERGKFPAYTNKYLTSNSKFIDRLPDTIKSDIAKFGIRNVSIMSFAPTGSISILNGSSSGIEPIYSLYYNRNTINNETGTIDTFEQYHPLLEKYFDIEDYNSKRKMKALKKKYNIVEAHDIDWKYRVKMQSVIQKYVDASISSTINLPEDTDVETIKNIYMESWHTGLKGITIYRDKSRDNVISVNKPKESKRKAIEKEFMKQTLTMLKDYQDKMNKLDNDEFDDVKDIIKQKDKKEMCPQCNSRTLINNNGCKQCINPNCGYAACNI